MSHRIYDPTRTAAPRCPSSRRIDVLLALVAEHPMTPEQRERQLASLAFGNAAVDDPRLTREAFDAALRAVAPPPPVR